MPKIAVLLGGLSAERDVSLASGLAVSKALLQSNHNVLAVDCAFGDQQLKDLTSGNAQVIQVTPSDIEKQRDRLNRNIFKTIDFLLKEKVDVVFNALHGGYGENGQLPALLDLAGIPYTGSGVLASALGMDKHLSKVIFQQQGVPTADWINLQSPDDWRESFIEEIGYPAVVKPNNQGSTVGLSIVQNSEEVPAALDLAFQYTGSVLLETYIPGRELTVTVLNDRPLPVVEIIPKDGFYDYRNKYQPGKTQYVVPAEIPDRIRDELQAFALQVYKAIGCRHYSRIDFRMTPQEESFCLEVNTHPGMTATSLVPKAARALGIEFPELVNRIIHSALA
ncbi:MAG: D-alanine--D-alanine ligase [Calditrichia bacterium]